MTFLSARRVPLLTTALLALSFAAFFLITRPTVPYEPAEQIHVLHDKNGTLSAHEAAQLFRSMEATGNLADEAAAPAYSERSGFRFSPGFFKGAMWIQLRTAHSEAERVLDLGPEIVDRAELYAPEENAPYDSCGRRTSNAQCRSVSWRSGLLLPPERGASEPLLLRVESSDSVSLVLRVFKREAYIAQTLSFSAIHTMMLTLMLVTALFLLCAFGIVHDRLIIYLSAMSLSFAFYLISMTGIGNTYLWNALADTRFFSRFGYVCSSLGFLFLQLFFLRIRRPEPLAERAKVRSALLWFLLASCFLSVVLYAALADISVLYVVTIPLVLFGCVFITALNFHSLRTERRTFQLLVSGWIPLFAYVFFRQCVHLLRLRFDVSGLERFFDNDYYFGYALCFLANLIIYSLVVFSKLTEAFREYNSRRAKKIGLYEAMCLSAREIEISELLLENYSNKEIAEKLCIATSTVATHIQHIYEKGKVTRRTEWVQKFS